MLTQSPVMLSAPVVKASAPGHDSQTELVSEPSYTQPSSSAPELAVASKARCLEARSVNTLSSDRKDNTIN